MAKLTYMTITSLDGYSEDTKRIVPVGHVISGGLTLSGERLQLNLESRARNRSVQFQLIAL